ncbi:MAG: hypothetical protein DHS20C16_19000 [Phycisphaerae bacterium]|nr:MAG: hypothetical protein DHS20C16_19000 [Phycisphaerae bacterium]
MTPVDLGQYTPNRSSQNSSSPVAGSAGFDDLLAQVQSLQFSALANTSVVETMVADGSFGPNEQPTGGGAREARINQETQAARQSEVASQNTRGADPSSVQNGVVSERHERVLTQQSLAAEGKPAAEPKAPATSAETPRIAELPAAAGSAESKPATEKETTQQPGKPDAAQQSTTTSGNSAASNQEQKTGGESGFDRSNSNAAPSKAIAVQTTGAAAAANDSSSSKQATSAQRIGQLLAGKTSALATQTAGSEAQTQIGREPSSKNAAQSQSGKARSTGQAQGRTPAEGPEQTKRSEFETLVKSIRMNRGTKSSSATIRLNPPELGKMKIHAQMSDDVLRVRVEAASSAARSLLTERSSELLAALSERGIDVDRFEVVQPEAARMDLEQGDEQGANVPGQSLAAQGDGQHTEDTNSRHDSDSALSNVGQDEQLTQDEVESVAQDAQLDVLV